MTIVYRNTPPPTAAGADPVIVECVYPVQVGGEPQVLAADPALKAAYARS